ncbi:hypothetical protein [Deinococcus yavapaiensis]|uniref:hypothetical protein n=1 Tax=Deinococcus yavapaiensis TaxID=309889 RepID=UPI0011B73112|nr:hypothetical protein [Deinococcus yavapaiensis]
MQRIIEELLAALKLRDVAGKVISVEFAGKLALKAAEVAINVIGKDEADVRGLIQVAVLELEGEVRA